MKGRILMLTAEFAEYSKNKDANVKKWMALVVLLAGAVCRAATDGAEMEARRLHFQRLFEVDATDYDAMERLYARAEQDGESIAQQIREAIAINDEEINRQVITYVFWRAMPFDVRLPFAKPEEDPKVQASYDQLRWIEGLKPFLLGHLADSKPQRKIIFIVALLYKDDAQVVEQLIGMATANESLVADVLTSLVMAGISHPEIEPLVSQAISGEDPDPASAAAAYLRQFPMPAALPHVVRQLRRPDSDLDSATCRDQFIAPPETNATNEACRSEKKQEDEVRWDGWRFGMVMALQAYDNNDLARHADDIIHAKDYVRFGPISQCHYDFLVRERLMSPVNVPANP